MCRYFGTFFSNLIGFLNKKYNPVTSCVTLCHAMSRYVTPCNALCNAALHGVPIMSPNCPQCVPGTCSMMSPFYFITCNKIHFAAFACAFLINAYNNSRMRRSGMYTYTGCSESFTRTLERQMNCSSSERAKVSLLNRSFGFCSSSASWAR